MASAESPNLLSAYADSASDEDLLAGLDGLDSLSPKAPSPAAPGEPPTALDLEHARFAAHCTVAVSAPSPQPLSIDLEREWARDAECHNTLFARHRELRRPSEPRAGGRPSSPPVDCGLVGEIRDYLGGFPFCRSSTTRCYDCPQTRMAFDDGCGGSRAGQSINTPYQTRDSSHEDR